MLRNLRKYWVIIKFLFLQNNRSDSNFNRKFDYEFGMQGAQGLSQNRLANNKQLALLILSLTHSAAFLGGQWYLKLPLSFHKGVSVSRVLIRGQACDFLFLYLVTSFLCDSSDGIIKVCNFSSCNNFTQKKQKSTKILSFF